MQTRVLEHRGYVIVVQPEQNAYGAWQAKVSVRHADSPVAEFRLWRPFSRNGLHRRRRSATASNGARDLSITSWKSRTTRCDGAISRKRTKPGRIPKDAAAGRPLRCTDMANRHCPGAVACL